MPHGTAELQVGDFTISQVSIRVTASVVRKAADFYAYFFKESARYRCFSKYHYSIFKELPRAVRVFCPLFNIIT